MTEQNITNYKYTIHNISAKVEKSLFNDTVDQGRQAHFEFPLTSVKFTCTSSLTNNLDIIKYNG